MKRHRCIYCGSGGARSIVAGGWAHKRCIRWYQLDAMKPKPKSAPSPSEKEPAR